MANEYIPTKRTFQSRNTLQAKARRSRKDRCERCGAADRLQAHHLDQDWCNNDDSNILTLCRPCHVKEHRKTGGFQSSRGADLSPQPPEVVREAARWMADHILEWFALLEKWTPRSRRRKPRYVTLQGMYTRARHKFGLSVWHHNCTEILSLAQQFLVEKGLPRHYQLEAMRRMERKGLSLR